MVIHMQVNFLKEAETLVTSQGFAAIIPQS